MAKVLWTMSAVKRVLAMAWHLEAAMGLGLVPRTGNCSVLDSGLPKEDYSVPLTAPHLEILKAIYLGLEMVLPKVNQLEHSTETLRAVPWAEAMAWESEPALVLCA